MLMMLNVLCNSARHLFVSPPTCGVGGALMLVRKMQGCTKYKDTTWRTQAMPRPNAAAHMKRHDSHDHATHDVCTSAHHGESELSVADILASLLQRRRRLMRDAARTELSDMKVIPPCQRPRRVAYAKNTAAAALRESLHEMPPRTPGGILAALPVSSPVVNEPTHFLPEIYKLYDQAGRSASLP